MRCRDFKIIIGKDHTLIEEFNGRNPIQPRHMHLTNHVPLTRSRRCIKLHINGIESRTTTTTEGARTDDRNDVRYLRERVARVAHLSEIKPELSGLVFDAVISYACREVVNTLGPNHTVGARRWLRDVDHWDTAVLISTHVDHHLVFVIGRVHVRRGGDSRLQNLIGTQRSRPREDGYCTRTAGADDTKVGGAQNNIT